LGEVSSNYDDEKIDIDKPVNCKEDLDEIKNIFDQIDELDQLMIEEEDDESETVIENSNKNFGSKSEITLESIKNDFPGVILTDNFLTEASMIPLS
jgi:hypothetical protein